MLLDITNNVASLLTIDALLGMANDYNKMEEGMYSERISRLREPIITEGSYLPKGLVTNYGYMVHQPQSAFYGVVHPSTSDVTKRYKRLPRKLKKRLKKLLRKVNK